MGDVGQLKAELEGSLICSTFTITRPGSILFIRWLFSGYFVPLFVPFITAKWQVYYGQVLSVNDSLAVSVAEYEGG